MICEYCKKRNECKVAEAYIAMKDIIRITECDEYEEDKKTNKIISIFDYFGRKWIMLYKIGDIIINLKNVTMIKSSKDYLYIEFVSGESYRYFCENPEKILNDIYLRF